MNVDISELLEGATIKSFRIKESEEAVEIELGTCRAQIVFTGDPYMDLKVSVANADTSSAVPATSAAKERPWLTLSQDALH